MLEDGRKGQLPVWPGYSRAQYSQKMWTLFASSPTRIYLLSLWLCHQVGRPGWKHFLRLERPAGIQGMPLSTLHVSMPSQSPVEKAVTSLDWWIKSIIHLPKNSVLHCQGWRASFIIWGKTLGQSHSFVSFRREGLFLEMAGMGCVCSWKDTLLK